ncbi:MAG: hypothetical protein KJ583_02325 [Nanoarchaeota archaeon]|nr:hypothetical protein [Nanoarchaeota archaeon]MBU1269753.1 hypothetical protein [Nanoarchaeota archaeon]MBU1604131.1 hypothetical protein [Nanoarchaeota archaeon]MBU2443924.1 hypothetical protein [Nanoarchaeota archaeon]
MHSLLESDLESICSSCRKQHNNNFVSSFDSHARHAHYKTKSCEHCGYEISFRTGNCSGI